MSIGYTDTSQRSHAEKERAELYMRIYKYSAEDFTSIPDVDKFCKDVIRYCSALEQELSRLGSELKKHTHQLTTHYHIIPAHTHDVPPHTHIVPQAPTGALPSGPPVAPIITLPNSNALQTNDDIQNPKQSEKAINSEALAYNAIQVPAQLINSTGVTSNSSGNFIIKSLSQSGDLLEITTRRSKLIPILNIPTLPPVLRVGL